MSDDGPRAAEDGPADGSDADRPPGEKRDPTDRWPGALPGETRVGRVALRVSDPETVAEFYERVVGLAVLERGAERTVLGVEDRPLLVLLAAPETPPRGDREAGLFHTAFRVPSRVALGACLERIDREATLSGASDHLVSEALYLRDPEGNGVEVYWDRPREDWPVDERGRPGMDTLALDLDDLRSESDDTDIVPAGTDIGHVHLEVTALPEALSFWADEVGLGVSSSGGSAAFLAAGDYHHHVGINTWNRRTEPRSGRGLAWVELLVPPDGLASARQRLGPPAEPPADTAPGDRPLDDQVGMTVTDPDGIEVRLRSLGERSR